LHPVRANAKKTLFLTLGSFPLIEPELAFDKDRATLGQILFAGLGLTAPDLNIDVGDGLLDGSVLSLVAVVNRDGQIPYRRTFGRVAHFRIARQVPHEKNFIEIGHGRFGA